MLFFHKCLLQAFQKVPSLLYLYVQRNQLKEVPSGLPLSLEQLRLGKNRISKISPGAFNKMGNLTLLDLYDNQVRPMTYSWQTYLWSEVSTKLWQQIDGALCQECELFSSWSPRVAWLKVKQKRSLWPSLFVPSGMFLEDRTALCTFDFNSVESHAMFDQI